ncbi:MAG: polysaccharide biosynthesis/export family protein [Aureisphaera sp.]
MKQFLLLVSTLFLLVSCATKKQIIYFQDTEGLSNQENPLKFEPVIENNDVLHISISSMSREAVEPFRRKTGLEGNVGNANPTLQGYLVNSEGTINYPVLGALKASGKTRTELQMELKSKLSEFITDVVVDVRIMNFKVTVLGGVNNPGVYNISDEQVSLPQALGLAGDLSEDGRRDNIMVIREENGKQAVTRVDLTKTDLFSSPYYFLKQNDVVYVEPSLKGVKKSGFIPDVPALLSLFTVVLTSVILITR